MCHYTCSANIYHISSSSSTQYMTHVLSVFCLFNRTWSVNVCHVHRLQGTHVPHIAGLIAKCRSRCVLRMQGTHVPHISELITDYRRQGVPALWGTHVTYTPGLIKGCRQACVRRLQETHTRLISTLFGAGGCWWARVRRLLRSRFRRLPFKFETCFHRLGCG